MDPSKVTVSAKIDAGIFRSFAIFDAMRLKKRWRSPLIFASILSVCACVCFIMKERREGAFLLGWVLLGAGLGIPAAYFLNFFLSLRSQCKKMKPGESRVAYTLTLDEREIRVSNEKESASLPWKKAFAAYRVKDCIYLYAVPQKAYLLPAGCADTEDEKLWALIARRMPEGRAIDKTK